LRDENIGRLLLRAFQMFESSVLGRLGEHGFAVDPVEAPVLRSIDVEGSNITEIAERAGLAKQTVGPIVRRLQQRGVVTVEPDPEDGRARIVRYSPVGLEGLAAGIDAIVETSAAWREELGPARYRQLEETLRQLLRLHGDSPGGRGDPSQVADDG
jgi:DNA-binding MarR family transcriptional regulator